MKRLHIVHRTGFRYESPAVASYNEARMTPLTTPNQTTLDSRVDASPVTWTYAYWDYWGTRVTAFEAVAPHGELRVTSTSTIEVSPRPQVDASAGWDVLGRDSVRDEFVELLTQTVCTQPVDEVVVLARDVAADLGPDAAARALCAAIDEQVSYVPGVTSVHSDAVEVWSTRKGVCQDFAHLTIGALRSLGIPARYVSGYLHPRPDAPIGETVEGRSHAWVEWWAGDWVAYDPTHASMVGGDHVLVARGRDYTDVTPLKGVYAGSAGSELFVSVEVTQLA